MALQLFVLTVLMLLHAWRIEILLTKILKELQAHAERSNLL